jgi:maltooligosyltrehalose trehalohydrolase
MAPDTRPGWWTAAVECAPGHPADYAFRVDGGEPLPDPRSLRQPSGPLGFSRTFDPASFEWSDASWRGAPLPGAVVYELHVGTFTAEGTLDAAIARLPYLRDLGVTAVELMPLASFPGSHGWGYDGIGLFAVHEPYGGPAALQRFVDAAHELGLAVLLDVVYNHVGPGSQLDPFGPYLTSAHTTPWGPAINLDQAGSDGVRSFIVDNALMWLRDFHIDGLRLDAVHALEDRRPVHILEALAAAVDALAAATGRSLILIAESDLNDPRLITGREAGGYGLDGQWNDDFHHCVHAAVTGERQGYYADFGSMAALAKVFTRAYFHDGTWSSFRGRSHGRPAGSAPAYRFVVFAQDHDQVGNRAIGDRLPATLATHPRRDGLLRVTAGLVLLSPFTPMLFMGEEWGADTPWQFFTDHTDPLFASAVSQGRRSEFAAHGWGFADVPDPQDPATFRRSKLDWSQVSREPHASLLAWYQSLLDLRRSRPELTDPRLSLVSASYDEEARWLLVHRGSLRIAANLGESPATLPVADGTLLTASTPEVVLGPDSVTLPPASLAVVQVALRIG